MENEKIVQMLYMLHHEVTFTLSTLTRVTCHDDQTRNLIDMIINEWDEKLIKIMEGEADE